MLADLTRAFAMLTEPKVRRTLLLSLGVAAVLLVLMFPAAEALFELAGSTGYPWLDGLLNVLGLVGTAVLAWFLFPVVIAAVLGFLLDAVVEATERRHFPGLPPPREESLLHALVNAVGFGLLVLAVNLASLPLYLIPGLNLPVYILINSYLLGREYVEIVLLRRAPRGELPALRRQHRGQLWSAGLVTAVLLMIPFLNLVAPIVGSAFATLQLLRRRGAVAV